MLNLLDQGTMFFCGHFQSNISFDEGVMDNCYTDKSCNISIGPNGNIWVCGEDTGIPVGGGTTPGGDGDTVSTIHYVSSSPMEFTYYNANLKSSEIVGAIMINRIPYYFTDGITFNSSTGTLDLTGIGGIPEGSELIIVYKK